MTPIGGYLANLRAGLRLAFFLPARLEELHATPLALVALCATALLIQFAEDFAAVGLDGEFTPDGVQGVLFVFALLTLLAVLACAATSRVQETLRLATALAALSLPIQLAWPMWQSWFPAWAALAAAVAVLRSLRLNLASGITAVLLSALIVALPLGNVMQYRTLWAPAEDEDAYAEPKTPSAAREEVIYRQTELLQEAFDRVQPQRPEAIDLYYVGFGGYAAQDVFMREVRTVEQQMTERFGLQGHSISLLNNPKTALDMPLASVTSLRATLEHLGQVMDPEQDILFLFMTSHGQKDQRLSLEFRPLQFIDLTPEVLRRAFDDAGIKWRVVVVSACYSGGFIERLRDERTIVITAAAADRSSFGCTNEAEWTYFGRAFFDEALRSEPQLVRAFEKAKQSIARREEREGQETRSEPQIAAGALMIDKWNAYLRQLAAGSR
jgi:hypothetical protein